MVQIKLNSVPVTVLPREEEPLRLSSHLASAQTESGEVITITSLAPNRPFRFVIRGEKFVGEVDVEPMIQEAIVHIVRENDV